MRTLLVAAVLLVVGGCADALAERQAYLNTLVGRTEEDLVHTIGVPSRAFEVDGHRFLAYTESRVDIVPGPSLSPSPWAWNGWAYGGGWPPQVVQLVCETTFEIVAGRVASYTLRGNACG
jgi:hypothetical protein